MRHNKNKVLHNTSMCLFKHVPCHDFHKIHGVAHDSEDKSIPNRVDGMAGWMSRPKDVKKIEKDESGRINNYRLSLVDGHSFYEHNNEIKDDISKKEQEYLNNTDADDVFFKIFLKDNLLSKFNEFILTIKEEEGWGIWLPYTSLKYHSILATVLHWNINIQKIPFNNMYFKIIDLKDLETIFSVVLLDEINRKCLTISDINTNRTYDAKTKIGSKPMMNFGDVMCRLDGDVYIDKYTYANLRRISSWSTGLQYYDDILNRGSI